MAEDTAQPEMPALDAFIAGLLELPEGTPSDKALDILAWTLLGEAAGEGKEGMAAVAHVIKNRAESGLYPADVQRVALQPKQFSTWNAGQGGNDPQSRFSKHSAEFQEARRIAADVVAGRHQDPTGGAIYYWSPAGMKAMGKIDPSWADDVTGPAGRVKIGGHVFVAEHPVNPTAPTPMDKPKRVAMIQAVNDVLANRPLPAPAPLDPNNPLRTAAPLAAGAKPLVGRVGDFSTETRFAPGAGKGASGEVTYQAPDGGLKPATIVKTTAIDPTTGFPPKPKTSQLSNPVSPLAPRLTPQGLVVNNPDMTDPSTPTTANVDGVPTPVLNPNFDSGGRSPALASALARLGATVASKAGVNVSKTSAAGTAEGKAGATGSVKTSINLGGNPPGNVRVANAPEQQPIPSSWRPSMPQSTSSIVPTLQETIQKAGKGTTTARQNIQTARQEQKSQQPQFITKTRQVLVEEPEPPKASLKAGAGAALGAGLKPIGISGGGTAMLGAKATGGGALTYTAPVKKAPTYKTEEYQVRNPLYVAPKGPTAEEIAAWKRLQEERAAAAKAAAEAARLATLTPAGQAAQTPGIAHNYAPVSHAGERTDVFGNDMAHQPRSVQTSDRWNTGY